MTDQLKAYFKQLESAINGAASQPWHQMRQQALQHFSAQGFPSVKDEEYKYTPLGRILQRELSLGATALASSATNHGKKGIFSNEKGIHIQVENGQIITDLLPDTMPTGLAVLSLVDANNKYPEEVQKHLGQHARYEDDPYLALNTAFAFEGVFIKVEDGTQLEEPIIIHYHNDEAVAQDMITTRNLIIAGQNSSTTILEVFSETDASTHFTNQVSEVVVMQNARLNYLKLQLSGGQAYLMDNTCIAQYRDSVVNTFTFSLEGKIIRNNLRYLLEEENCESHMYGLYVTHGQTHVDNHTVVDHKVPHCFSNEIYKGILDDASKGVFNGKIFVRPDAQKTNAFQSNKNILLSDKATINTKPQLEIWADDVSCSHGCTNGQLDEEQLFYLRSRGISKQSATAMLLHAFVNDVLDKVPLDFLREYLDREMYNRLDRRS